MAINHIGIVGAGTMGSGIALAALYAGYEVILQDPFPASLDKARGYLESFLSKKGMAERMSQVAFSEILEPMAAADVVIEAALEQLELKQEIFANLESICRRDTILATNTSTISVTGIASATEHPARVAGMHFFNPPAVLKLVEIVRGLRTSEDTVHALAGLAKSLGKTPVIVQDAPGFVVNRVARPFYGEALRLLGEKTADHETIDRALETGAGFRMGPFRLMDLIGIDINAIAMRSMYEQTFGEPRYRPHWIQMQMMQSGQLGRKTGRGFYDYEEPTQIQEEHLPQPESAPTGWVLVSDGSFGPGLVGELVSAGWKTDPGELAPAFGVAIAGREEGLLDLLPDLEARLPENTPLLVQCADVSLSEAVPLVRRPARLVGFDGLFLADGRAATLVASRQLNLDARWQAESFMASLGKDPLWVADSPGLILPRVVCMLINEAAFAVLDGIAEADTIDLAMKLGVSYPQGPLAWGRSIGYRRVLSVLDHMRSEYGEERYRACVLLRRWAREGG